MKSNKVIGISLLRVFACFCVFMVHFGQRTSLSGVLRVITDRGQHGVRLFFVISGYLACLTWYNRHKDLRRETILEYYKKRAIRLLPLYYFCILYYFVTETFFWRDVPADPYGLYWLRYIFLLNGIIPGDAYFWSNLGITWTIPLFAYFYLMFPFIAYYCDTFRKTAILFIVTVVLSIIRTHFMGDWLVVLKHAPVFLIGIMTYHAVQEHREKQLLLIMLAITVSSICGITILLFIYGAISAVLILLFRNITINNSTIRSIILTLDKYSYTVYLAHGIIFCGLLDKLGLSPKRTALIAVVGTAILTVFIYHAIERPIQDVLLKRVKRSG